MTKDEINLSNFAAAQPKVAQWLADSEATNNFAKSLREAVKRYGDLTAKQLAAANRSADRSADRPTVHYQSTEAKLEAFASEHPKIWAWLETKKGSFDFAKSLRESVEKYGSLTSRQLHAAQKCADRDADKDLRSATTAASTSREIDVSRLTQAFETARDSAAREGDEFAWLTLRLDTFKFTDVPAQGQWSAHIAVKEGDAKLGRIVRGRFQRTLACDDPTEDRIVAAAADPHAAAVAYGQRFKHCSCCGRQLTNAISRQLGIGPICRARYGWGSIPAGSEGGDE